MGRLKSDLKPGMVPVKRGRGRPPKHSYVNVGHLPAQDLTHIRPPAKRERTFYSSDEEDGEIFFYFLHGVIRKLRLQQCGSGFHP